MLSRKALDAAKPRYSSCTATTFIKIIGLGPHQVDLGVWANCIKSIHLCTNLGALLKRITTYKDTTADGPTRSEVCTVEHVGRLSHLIIGGSWMLACPFRKSV